FSFFFHATTPTAIYTLSLHDALPISIALLDACVRLLPGVVGCTEALAEESFADSLLEYPHYTRPQIWEGRAVPEVLVSGDHQRIDRKSTRLNSSHSQISYAVFCLKKK